MTTLTDMLADHFEGSAAPQHQLFKLAAAMKRRSGPKSRTSIYLGVTQVSAWDQKTAYRLWLICCGK